MNTPVNFEIAKLLKEKEYKDKNILGTVRLSEPKYYDPNGIIHEIKDAFEEKNYKIEDCFNAPTIAEVVMWCFDKYGIWVYADYYNENGWFGVFRTKEGVKKELFDAFNTPTEAYEAAIEYTLNNLI